MNRSTPGLPVHHHLPEFTQTHIHPVSDAIQPSHPLLSPLLLLPIPPSIRVFFNESTLCMPLQPSPNHPRTARGLFRQKRTVLIPHVRRELEHLNEDRCCSPVRLHKSSASHIRDTVDSCSYKTGFWRMALSDLF